MLTNDAYKQYKELCQMRNNVDKLPIILQIFYKGTKDFTGNATLDEKIKLFKILIKYSAFIELSFYVQEILDIIVENNSLIKKYIKKVLTLIDTKKDSLIYKAAFTMLIANLYNLGKLEQIKNYMENYDDCIYDNSILSIDILEKLFNLEFAKIVPVDIIMKKYHDNPKKAIYLLSLNTYKHGHDIDMTIVDKLKEIFDKDYDIEQNIFCELDENDMIHLVNFIIDKKIAIRDNILVHFVCNEYISDTNMRMIITHKYNSEHADITKILHTDIFLKYFAYVSNNFIVFITELYCYFDVCKLFTIMYNAAIEKDNNGKKMDRIIEMMLCMQDSYDFDDIFRTSVTAKTACKKCYELVIEHLSKTDPKKILDISPAVFINFHLMNIAPNITYINILENHRIFATSFTPERFNCIATDDSLSNIIRMKFIFSYIDKSNDHNLIKKIIDEMCEKYAINSANNPANYLYKNTDKFCQNNISMLFDICPHLMLLIAMLLATNAISNFTENIECNIKIEDINKEKLLSSLFSHETSNTITCGICEDIDNSKKMCTYVECGHVICKPCSCKADKCPWCRKNSDVIDLYI